MAWCGKHADSLGKHANRDSNTIGPCGVVRWHWQELKVKARQGKAACFPSGDDV